VSSKIWFALTAFATVGFVNCAIAQDFLYSQYFNSPLSLNPGMTGFMRPDYRVGAIQRNQWSQIGNPFITTGAFADVSLKVGAVKGVVTDGTPQIGLGVMVVNDQLGNGAYKVQQGLFSASFIKPLGAYYRHKVGVGVQTGLYNKKLNDNGLLFQDQINRLLQLDPTITSVDGVSRDRVSTFVINVGVHYSYLITKRISIYTGVSGYNLNNPSETFLKNPGAKQPKLDRRYYGLLGLTAQIANGIVINPSLVTQVQNGAFESNVGLSAAFHLSDVKAKTGLANQNPILLYIGGYYRLNDAVIPYVGLRYKAFTGGLSYDINTSSLSGSGESTIKRPRVRSLELSLIYTGFFDPLTSKRYTLPCKDYY
jgi:type IX secretion system PorP/SprF family membrane protein